MSLGKGSMLGVSTRQKLDTCTATKVEIVAVDDCMLQFLSIQYFSEAQGYGVDDSIIYQDNKAQCSWSKIGEVQVPSVLATSILDIILMLTRSTVTRSGWSSVQHKA